MKQMKVKRDDDEIDDRDEKVLEYQDGENNEMIILEEFEEDTELRDKNRTGEEYREGYE